MWIELEPCWCGAKPLIVRVDPNLAHVEEEAQLKGRFHQIAVLVRQAGNPRVAPGKDTCFDSA
jgi:hypothetical protein